MSSVKESSGVVRLQLRGKIGLGTEREAGKGSADYFICPDEVKKVLGEKPTKLRIAFPAEKSSRWMVRSFRRYSASRNLVCRGDGSTAITFDSTTPELTGKTTIVRLKEISCDPGSCSYFQRGECSRVVNLQFLLPDCPGDGVFQLDIGCKESIDNIMSFLRSMKGALRPTSIMPLILELTESKHNHEGRPRAHRVLKLSCPYSLDEIRRFEVEHPWQAVVLPATGNEIPDDILVEPQTGGEIERDPDRQEQIRRDLWTKTKSKLIQKQIQDFQIMKWFSKNYKMEVDSFDFDPPRPPARFTTEILTDFFEALDRHTEL